MHAEYERATNASRRRPESACEPQRAAAGLASGATSAPVGAAAYGRTGRRR
jgi:hypothetical protein